MARKLIVEIVGDSRSYEKALGRSERASKSFGNTMQSTSRRVSIGFGTILKSAAVLGGVTAAYRGISSAIRAGTNEFAENAKVVAQTNAVLKSTQGVANVTAGDVGSLARSLSLLTGVDDEAIQAGENLLLTFKNVRNEAGQGNAVFDRATKAALDLSTAGFGALDSTSKQLGKALNDPIRGMTALGRAGITFTQSQRDTIKSLVESGNLLGAQTLILREVESQVGGSAKAFGETLPGQINKAREAFRNMAGDLVGALAPAATRVLGAFTEALPAIQSGVTRLSGFLQSALGPVFGDLVATAREVLPGLLATFKSVFGPIKEFVVPVIRDVVNIIRGSVTNIVAVFDANREELTKIFTNLGEVIKSIWTIARPTLVFLFQTALPVALRVAIPIISKVTEIFRFQAKVVTNVVSFILKAIDKFLGGLSTLSDAASHLPLVGDKFKGVSDKINGARETLRDFAGKLDALNGKQVEVGMNLTVTAVDAHGRQVDPDDPLPDVKPKKPKKVVVEQAANAEAIIASITRQATAQKSVNQQLAESEKRAEHFKELLRTDPQNVKLQQRFSAELQKQVGLRQESADAAKASAEASRQDAKAAKDAAKAAAQARRDRERDRAERRRDAAKAAQFKALGLTAEGAAPTPGTEALLRRTRSLQEQLKGTALDPSKSTRQLQKIVNVLTDKTKKAGRDVRQAILDMLNTISGAGEEKQGPLTKGAGLNTKKVLEGMGLTPEQIDELRSRLSSVSGPTGGGGIPKGPPLPRGAATMTTGAGLVVESHTTINLDGQQVANVVTRQQQRQKRRNPGQKRGPNRRGI